MNYETKVIGFDNPNGPLWSSTDAEAIRIFDDMLSNGTAENQKIVRGLCSEIYAKKLNREFSNEAKLAWEKLQKKHYRKGRKS